MPTGPTAAGSGEPDEDRSLGEIVGDLTRDLGTLLKQEVELAKVEIKQEATKAGKGAGMLAGAGVAGHLVLVFLSLFLMFLLGMAMDLAWAALIVTVLWAVVAGVLAAIGRSTLRRVDPKLETTTDTLKEDARWAKSVKTRSS